jgi:uncharacterized membrane protein
MPPVRETPPRRTASARLRVGVAVAVACALVAYPILVHGLLSSANPSGSRLRVLWLAVPFIASLLLGARSWRTSSRLAGPVLALLLIGTAVWVDTAAPLLLVPVAINGTFLYTFGSTLLSPPPLIERFAKLQHADLNAAEIKWCRSWTLIWSAFFTVNIVVATALGLTQQLQLWALYNGLLSYIVMGCLFGIEYTLRKHRFGRYGTHPLDRLLQWCFERRRVPPP